MKYEMSQTWDGAIVDKSGWTDGDIITMIETEDISQYNEEEQSFIKGRYNELKNK